MIYQYIKNTDEIHLMVKYCKSLQFAEDPNYDYLKGLLKDMFTRSGYEYDYDFDWHHRTQVIGKQNPFCQEEEYKVDSPDDMPGEEM